MSKLTIAIDIDHVLADGTGYVIDSVNRRHGLSLTHTDYHAVGGEFWGYYERVWQAHGVSHIVRYEDVSEEMRSDQALVPLMPSADFAIGELSKRFHIVLITARPESWVTATRRWLAQHFNGSDIEIYFAGNILSKGQTTGMSKGQQAKLLNAQLLIDDNIGNCQSALSEGIDTLLFGEYGWQHDAPEGMVRCRDWPATLEYLNEFKR